MANNNEPHKNLPKEEIEGEIRQILNFAGIEDDNRISALLRYLVSEHLAGRGDRLKAYSIGVDVFDKKKDFNPSTDSIIRVETHRLRRLLKEYYTQNASTARIRIEIAKGTYNPSIYRINNASRKKAVESAKGLIVATGMMVAFFVVILGMILWDPLSLSRSQPLCGNGRPNVIVTESRDYSLKYDNIKSFLAYYSLIEAKPANDALCKEVPRFNLTLETSNDDESVVATVYSEPQRRIIWSKRYKKTNSPLVADLTLIPARIAYEVAYKDGVIPTAALGQAWRDSYAEGEFRCVMQTHQFFNSNPEVTYEEATKCMDKYAFTSINADVPALYAALLTSKKVADKERGLPFTSNANLTEKAMRRARTLDPSNSQLLIVNLRLLKFSDDPLYGDREDRNLRATSIAGLIMSRYPYEPHLLYQMANYYIPYSGRIEEGLVMANRANIIAQNSKNLFWPLVAAHIAQRQWEKLGPYLYELENIGDWYMILTELKVATVLQKSPAEIAAIRREFIKKSPYRSVEDVETALKTSRRAAVFDEAILDLAKEFLPKRALSSR